MGLPLTDPPSGTPPKIRIVSQSALGALLTVAVFANAALLFSLEPMASKQLLPLLGGTPSVWNTCLLFFQTALIVGYGYAHLSLWLLGVRRQAVLHVALVAISCLFLPVRLSAGGSPPVGDAAIVWLAGVLAISIGPPFVMLASGAPVAQRWLAGASTVDSRDPYFLYAASNLGSMCALLAYPVIVEPFFSVGDQARYWSVMYIAALVLAAVAAWMVWRTATDSRSAGPLPTHAESITWRERSRWTVYAAVPSSLLMGATSFISTDIAAVPLLWVIPLSIYLLTFVLVFARRPPVPHSFMVSAEPHLLVLVAVALFWAVTLRGAFAVLLHLALLFVVAMVCHGEIARSRPVATRLTEYYLWIAVGGMLGGVFNALVAPLVFDNVAEYAIAIAAAGLLRPPPASRATRTRVGDIVLPVLLAAGVLALTWRAGAPPEIFPTAVMIAMVLVLFSFRERRLRLAMGLALTFAIGSARFSSAVSGRSVVREERSFFGIYRVLEDSARNVRILEHGRTLHGVQAIDTPGRLVPRAYYHPDGPIGDVFTHPPAARLSRRRAAFVGLGVGSLSCYGRKGERWVYFEIDPLVAQIATDTTHFTFLRDCPPVSTIRFGDARQTLRRSSDGEYDILVLDAFSSDAIPVHLLTREAMREYLRVLAAGGVIAIHISNKYLDLEPVVASVAASVGAVARVRVDFPTRSSSGSPPDRISSVWVALARSEADLGPLASDSLWKSLRRRNDVDPWTDDFSNVLRIFQWT